MAKVLQHRRDTTTNLASVSGAIGEFFMDTTKNTLVVMDGSTTGGHPLALESSLSNYVTSTCLSSTLGSYVTSTCLSSTLGSYVTSTCLSSTLGNYATSTALNGLSTCLSTKQDTLVSGTNIKTVNGSTILGSGNITISSGAECLNQLSDVSTSYNSNGQVLAYDSGTCKFTNTSLYLNNLSNVCTNYNSNGQVLAYDSGTCKFINTSLYLNNLSNVSTSYNSNGQVLAYNSGTCTFGNTSLYLNNLSNVCTNYNSNGQVLAYDSSSCKFINTSLYLNNLYNVCTTSPQNGQVLTYDSGTCKFINATPTSGGAECLNQLSDVSTSYNSNGQVLAYNSGTCTFGNTSLYLNNLFNVCTTSPQNGQVLTYDSATCKFINATPTGGGGGATSLCGLSDVTTTAVSNYNLLQADYYGIFRNIPTCNVKNLGSVVLSENGTCIPGTMPGPDKNFLSFEHLGGQYGTTPYKNIVPKYDGASQCSVVSRSIVIGQQTLGYSPGSCAGYTNCVSHVDQIVLGTKAGWGVGQLANTSPYYAGPIMNCSNIILGTSALSTSGCNCLGEVRNNVVIGHYADACARTLADSFPAAASTNNTDNIIIGTCAAFNSDAQNANIVIGQEAFKNKKGGNAYTNCYSRSKDNIIIGRSAASASCPSWSCTTRTAYKSAPIIAIGSYAAANGNFGDHNVAIGESALMGYAMYGAPAPGYSCKNTAVGRWAGMYSGCGMNNTFFGYRAGTTFASTGMCTNCNTFIGSSSGNVGGYNVPFGSGITVVGANAGNSYGLGSNVTLLGYGATPSTSSANNEITLGNGNVYTLRANVQSITALSDARDKESIESVPYGLDFLKKVRPVSFTWNTRDGAKQGGKELGFIAQELDEAMESSQLKEWLSGLVLKSNPDRLEASEGKLLPLIVKAIQELDQRLTELENKG